MQLRAAFPVDTVGGACFVTLRHEVDEGMVIDLDRDLEAMPAWGRLCLLPQAVRDMNELLGWKIDTGTSVKQLKLNIESLEVENERLRKALRDVMEVVVHAGTVDELLGQL